MREVVLDGTDVWPRSYSGSNYYINYRKRAIIYTDVISQDASRNIADSATLRYHSGVTKGVTQSILGSLAHFKGCMWHMGLYG